MTDSYGYEYDKIAKKAEWYGPDVLFGLAYEYVSEGQSLLDLGIGTGLSSLPFYLAGLDVVGLDISPDMLLISEQKKFAKDLTFHDLNSPLPYPPESFDHVISCGVFHLFKDFDKIVEEAARVVKTDGIIGFTIIEKVSGNAESILNSKATEQTTIFKHTPGYIDKLANKYNLNKLKNCSFKGFTREHSETYFSCYILKKKEQ